MYYTMSKTKVEDKFSDFFEKWVCQLEDLLSQLVRVAKDGAAATTPPSSAAEMQALVAKVTSHVKAYYTAKWAAAHEDVLAFFSPIWLSPLENAFQWITGWKPSTVFRLVESLRKSGLKGMSEHQAKRIDELRAKIRLEEEKVEREMERQQVAMADRRTVELARLPGGGGGGGAPLEGLVEAAVIRMMVGLERVMKAADCVRLKALKGVLDELSPTQCVQFLAAHSVLLLQLRHWGRKRSSSNTSPATATAANNYSCCNDNKMSPSTPC